MSEESHTVKIPDNILKKSKEFGDKLLALKEDYKSSRYLNTKSHEIAKLGEWVFSNRFNIEGLVDWEVRKEGDGKYDFLLGTTKIDVKTTTYYKYPELRCFANEDQADIYVLVALAKDEGLARLAGFASRAKLFHCRNYQDYRGLGKRYVLTEDELCKDWSICHEMFTKI